MGFMILSDTTLNELRDILKDEFSYECGDVELSNIANNLLRHIEILVEIDNQS